MKRYHIKKLNSSEKIMDKTQIKKAILETGIEIIDQLLVKVDTVQAYEEDEDARIKEREAFDHLDKAIDLLTEVSYNAC